LGTGSSAIGGTTKLDKILDKIEPNRCSVKGAMTEPQFGERPVWRTLPPMYKDLRDPSRCFGSRGSPVRIRPPR